MRDVTMKNAGVQQRFVPWNSLASFATLKMRYVPLIAPTNPFRTATREVASWMVLPASRVITRRRIRLWIDVAESLDRRLERDLLLGDNVIWTKLDDRLRDRLEPKDSEVDTSESTNNLCLNELRPHVFINPLRTFSMMSSFFPSICTVSWW